MALTSSLTVSTGTDNPAKPVSKGEWNDLIDKSARGLWITPQDFGAIGDGATDDGPAFQAAIDYLYTQRVQNYGYGNGGSRGLYIPTGVYYLGTTTLEIKHSMRMLGDGVGHASGGASVLKWADATTGIRLVGYGTTGDAGIADVTQNGAGRVHIQGLHLWGGFNAAESDHYGINVRSSATIRDVYIRGFPGDGIYSFTDIVNLAGNSNCSFLENVHVELCRHGFVMDGQDANAWSVINCSAVANRGCGFLDSSFLGNFFFGCHVSTNGDGGAAFPSRSHYLGKHYYVLRGQEAWCAANAPSGTTANNQGWAYYEAGGITASWPAWTNGAAYRCGAGYVADNLDSGAQFVACYCETDSVSNQMAGSALFHGIPVGIVALDGSPWGGCYQSHGSSVKFNKTIEATNLFLNGENHVITGADPYLTIDATNAYAALIFANNGATTSSVFGFAGDQYIDVAGGANALVARFNGTEAARFNASGLSLASSKTINFASLVNAANDAAAASGGVAVGSVYRNGSALMVRVS